MIECLPISTLDARFSADAEDVSALNGCLRSALKRFDKKIVVLDDDPTGVQTVHGISVYTSWDAEALRAGFLEEQKLFFVLTNSRSFTAERTTEVHAEIARNLCLVSQQTGKDFTVISRGDSTLRGHFPTETLALRDGISRHANRRFDGEILLPFFPEGGRYTFGDVHYVREKDWLVPAGQTEFARDKTFGYHSSHLGDYVEEKTKGAFTRESCAYISIEELRGPDLRLVTKKLLAVKNFGKVIVNAVDDTDVKRFVIAYIGAVEAGGSYLFRSAAVLPKVLGGLEDRPLLRGDDLVDPRNRNGGLVLIGSHVGKTTQQFQALQSWGGALEFLEFDQHRALEPDGLERETDRVASAVNRLIASGKNCVVYTRRERLDLDSDDSALQLAFSVRISDAVTDVVRQLSVRPRFIVAKGGITSHDVGVKALGVRCATVAGQVAPGIPVWRTGPESKFPDMSYVIFPGNVGETDTLLKIVQTLTPS